MRRAGNAARVTLGNIAMYRVNSQEIVVNLRQTFGSTPAMTGSLPSEAGWARCYQASLTIPSAVEGGSSGWRATRRPCYLCGIAQRCDIG